MVNLDAAGFHEAVPVVGRVGPPALFCGARERRRTISRRASVRLARQYPHRRRFGYGLSYNGDHWNIARQLYQQPPFFRPAPAPVRSARRSV